MKKKAQTDIMGIGIAAILVIIFIAVIWGLQSSATTLSTSTNESFTSVNDTFVALTNDDFAVVSAVRNATQYALTVTTHYVVDYASGRINITTAGAALSVEGNTTHYADYTYRATGYVTNTIARLVLSFVTVMVAIGLIVFLAKGGKE